ncbi:hypothetical protein Q7C36_001504 [Tachysurus vachellii]|uniref:Uncharacterized protein n=1 Tax=Tachysurus vachellii TaxID=175792 RepID=A0AA88NXV2_TACVA|nr:hypothetical protein Q7C36_001504 [Tachysurus vachellii]
MSIRRDGADGTRTDEAVSTVDMKDPVLFWEPDKVNPHVHVLKTYDGGVRRAKRAPRYLPSLSGLSERF